MATQGCDVVNGTPAFNYFDCRGNNEFNEPSHCWNSAVPSSVLTATRTALCYQLGSDNLTMTSATDQSRCNTNVPVYFLPEVKSGVPVNIPKTQCDPTSSVDIPTAGCKAKDQGNLSNSGNSSVVLTVQNSCSTCQTCSCVPSTLAGSPLAADSAEYDYFYWVGGTRVCSSSFCFCPKNNLFYVNDTSDKIYCENPAACTNSKSKDTCTNNLGTSVMCAWK